MEVGVTMGHNSINKGYSEREVLTSLNCPASNREISDEAKRQTSCKMDFLMNTNDSSKNNRIYAKGVTLIMNIAPSFFHLLSVNSYTKRTFNYLYDAVINNNNNNTNNNSNNNNINNNNDNNKSNKLEYNSIVEVPLKSSHNLEIPYSKLRNTIVQLNIFNERCACQKCLSATYLFTGNQASHLRNEFIRALSSEHCKKWNEEWLKIILQQILIFLCCIKDGVIYERLLESAALCAKMLLTKPKSNSVLEMKYSYIYFHMDIINIVNKKKITNNNNNKKLIDNKKIKKLQSNKIDKIQFKGTGKEEREIIDGISVISFQTEDDMNEYTNLELKYLHKFKSPSPENSSSDDTEIVPTKTTDITKIKGWRHKLFSPLGSPKSTTTRKSLYKNFDIYHETRKREKSYEKRKEKLINRNNIDKENTGKINDKENIINCIVIEDSNEKSFDEDNTDKKINNNSFKKLFDKENTGKVLITENSGKILYKINPGKILEADNTIKIWNKENSGKILNIESPGKTLNIENIGKALDAGNILSKDNIEKILKEENLMKKSLKDNTAKILDKESGTGKIFIKENSGKKFVKENSGKMFVKEKNSGKILDKEITEKVLEQMAENFLGFESDPLNDDEHDNKGEKVKLKAATVSKRCSTENLTVAADEQTVNVQSADKNSVNSPSRNGIGDSPKKEKERLNIINDLIFKESLNVAKSKNSVFESDALDDFLKNNARLNISYEIPTLHAAEKLTNRNEPEKIADKVLTKLDDENFDAINETNEKQSTPEISSNNNNKKLERYTQKKHFVKNLIKSTPSSSNPNLKFIWVQGRPIPVITGFQNDDKTPVTPKTSPPLNSVKKSTECQTEFASQSKDKQVTKTDSEDDSESDVRRPRLLSIIPDEETDCIARKIELPTDFNIKNIPIIHRCGKLEENDDSRCYKCSCKRFTLGMVLNIGRGRCLSKEAIENIELLSNGNEIDERLATIATSALATDPKQKTKNIIVPVVHKDILNSVKNWEHRLEFDRAATNIPSSVSTDIVPEVKKVVDDLLDYVERKMEPFCLEYDPMYTPPPRESPKKSKREKIPKAKSKVVRELRRLINVSVIDESEQSEKENSKSNCGNDFCSKGCICQSLNSKINFPIHCGKISCLFECTCSDKAFYSQNALKQMSDTVLAKEEMTWHQTIIRSEHGDKIEVMNAVDKSKREKKLPTRFRNNVLLGKEMYPSVPMLPPPSRITTICQDNQIVQKVSEENRLPPLKGISLKKQTLHRRLGFCADTIQGSRTLADVFIWCGIHDKYNCLCVSWICRLKNNAFIWKPEKNTRYLPHKLMSEMELTPNFSYEVYLYDPKRFSARTFGTPIEYAVRNRSETFLQKRECELLNNVLACTNSYIKMKFFMIKDKETKSDDQNKSEFDTKEVFKSTENENVYITHVSDEEADEIIEITDDLPPVPIDDVIIIPDSDEETEVIEQVSAKNGFVLDKPLNELFLHVTSEGDQKEMGIVLPGHPVKPFLKPPIKSYGRLQKINEKPAAVNLKPLIVDTTNSQSNDNDKRKKSSTDANKKHFINSENCENVGKKKKTIISLSDELEISPVPVKENNIDDELENDIIKLEDHPQAKNLFGPDNLPRLALLCLTPGIGYLPILEFTSDVLAAQDPVFPDLYRSFKNLDAANLWLNRFFKNRLIFESIDTTLKWVIVKPGILKLKQSPAFNAALLENPSIIITKDGGLIFKKKDYNTGGICRGAVKVEPLSLTGHAVQQVVTVKEHSDNKRKIAHLTTETYVDICDSEGKRRKIQLETIPITGEQILKRPVNIFRQFPSMTGSSPTTTATFVPASSLGNNSGFMRINIDSCDKSNEKAINGGTLFKSTIRPLIVSSPASGPLRLQVSPSGITNLCSRNPSTSRSLSPPPLALRSDVVTTQAINSVSTSVPLAASKLIAQDGRPVFIHNNTIIPINIKTQIKPKSN
ncbi:hypothetical protein O3M35_004011 [Rhynocoris fuscipes]|uniref:MGA conserved domain-containing protein n=1 Tax=Rhynocoris fuscipes TaxID=488301 RepID=A0AAW1CH33_9HEMI